MKATAIIGGGASSAIALLSLLKKKSPQRVTIFEKKNPMGCGLAYSTQSAHHVLNVRAAHMSLLIDEPGHFCAWLKAKKLPFQADDFVPRSLYGNYIQDTVQKKIIEMGQIYPTQFQVDFVKAEVCDLDYVNPLIEVTFNEIKGDKVSQTRQFQKKLKFDQVLLATGNENPTPLISPGSAHRHVIEDVWGFDFSKVKKEHRVLVVGAGLTAIDAVLELHERTDQPIQILSRHGILPQAHTNERAHVEVDFSSLLRHRNSRLYTKELRILFHHMETRHLPWQIVIEQLKPHVQTLWRQLSLEEQKRFMRHLLPRWISVRNRMPKEVASKIQELFNKKKLLLRAGRISKILSEDAHSYDLVLNCTGASTDITRINPLLRSMAQKGLIQADPLRLGLATQGLGQCLQNDGQARLPIYALGKLLRGSLWEITALPDIRVQIDALIQGLS